MTEDLAVEVVVELQRSRLRDPYETLAVEQYATRARERRDRLRRELVARERRDVHPARRGERGGGGRAPLAPGPLDVHRPDVAVVGERERRRRLAAHEAHR